MGLLNYILGWKQLGIARDDLVLEVGSGGNPLIRSDVLCDKFIFDDMERAVGKYAMPISTDRPFVCGDAEALPFRNKAFDFLVSFHMIEHLERPERFLAEAQRVARGGYIVSPNSRCEVLFGSFRHRWIIDLSDDNVLHIKTKTEGGAFLDGFFYDLYENNTDFRKFWHRNQTLFETRYRWNATIDYVMDDIQALSEVSNDWFAKASLEQDRSPQTPAPIPAREQLKRSAKHTAKRLAIPFIGRREFDLQSLVVCPLCHGQLEAQNTLGVMCHDCLRVYPCADGTMLLIPELASRNP